MNILAEVQEYVTRLFSDSNDDTLRYHNIRHTRNVVEAARLIAGKCRVAGRPLEELLVAAWFHDVGYLHRTHNHEDISKQYAREFLQSNGMDQEYIEQVEKCIEATRVPQDPQDQLSAILCDADLYHVSREDFMEDTQIFWDELNAMNGEELDDSHYLERTLRFFNDHHFHTHYGKTILKPGKDVNMLKVKKALEQRQKGKSG